MVSISPEEISQFEKDNLTLKNTLDKIEKAMRKNVSFSSSNDDSILFKSLPNFEDSMSKGIIE